MDAAETDVMLSDDESTKKSKSEDQVIDRLYEVAVDPTRYEALLDQWEALFAPLRGTANSDNDPQMQLASFEGHFRRAGKVLSDVTSGAGGADTEPHQLLHQIGQAAGFVVDRGLAVSHVNAAASSALGITTGAKVATLALGDGEAEVLERRIERLLLGNSGEPCMVRVRSALAGRAVLMHLRLVRPEVHAPFVIALASELGWPDGFSDLLSRAFELTKTEVTITRALAEGHALSQIAEDRERSIETIRAQVKSIMAKTETRSQAELVRLTLSTMEMAQFSDEAAEQLSDNSSGFGTLETRPFQTLMLRDGRRLDYLILGDPVGKPVFFFPLDYGLVRWPAGAEAEAAQRGMKIIVPVRPGYGASTPLPKGTPYSAQIAEDMAALLDHLKVKRLPVVTLGGDSFFAASMHATYPERFSALICCAGVLPLTRPEQYERMEKWHRFILAGARYTPHLLPFMVKAGFALAHKLGKRGFVQAVYGKSSADVETFEIPEVFEAMVCGSEVALSDSHSAHDAFAREVICHETADWTEEVAALKQACVTGQTPVHFLNGLQDPQIPPATLSEYQRDYDWIDFTVYPDAGQLLFFLKWRDVLTTVEKYI
jgi:pimeloyl-ACP methyl ester carboxylesterase/DNA-binding CsgD family transcriptional regulator